MCTETQGRENTRKTLVGHSPASKRKLEALMVAGRKQHVHCNKEETRSTRTPTCLLSCTPTNVPVSIFVRTFSLTHVKCMVQFRCMFSVPTLLPSYQPTNVLRTCTPTSVLSCTPTNVPSALSAYVPSLSPTLPSTYPYLHNNPDVSEHVRGRRG